MLKITLATPDDRREYPAQSSKTVIEFLQEQHTPVGNNTVILDGTALTPDDLNRPLNELVTGDECLLAICAKLTNG